MEINKRSADSGWMSGRVPRASWVMVLLAVAVPVVVGELAGKVVGITDGDTLTLLVGTPPSRSKSAWGEIDAPELGQPYGAKAKQALSSIAFGKLARVGDTYCHKKHRKKAGQNNNLMIYKKLLT